MLMVLNILSWVAVLNTVLDTASPLAKTASGYLQIGRLISFLIPGGKTNKLLARQDAI